MFEPASSTDPKISPVVVIISADAEWRAARPLFPQAVINASPYGEWLAAEIAARPVIFFHGGWGKISAAASAQYALDAWKPDLLVNLGTCGGFEGQIERGEIILVEKTIVYDIIEQMGDPQEHIAHYTTHIDLSWLGLPYPTPVRRALLVSGDRDLLIEDIPNLKSLYGAAAGDWESGAIAFVASRNRTRLLILRGVTDLVGASGGEAYGNIELFREATSRIMKQLIEWLPAWLEWA
ncbi:MAG: hypothetical protein JXB15_06040 [Anaerolineales bacterium]|nr:hypothetical protein [Anaerolineales bacterium]